MGEIRTYDPISFDVPQIGVGVVVKRGGRYLLGIRKGTERGQSTWSTPGGSVAPAETVLACAVRELQEETGLRAERARVVFQTRNRLEDGRQLAIGLRCGGRGWRWRTGVARIAEVRWLGLV